MVNFEQQEIDLKKEKIINEVSKNFLIWEFPRYSLVLNYRITSWIS